jgi:hypothetical protein
VEVGEGFRPPPPRQSTPLSRIDAGKAMNRQDMKPIANAAVARVFEAYPSGMRRKLLFLRQLILDTAARTDEVGEIEETLKWGEPAYLTKSKSGSTVRIDWKKTHPSQYAMYFHCQTNLVETFRTLFPDDFKFEGNRSIVFQENDVVPVDALEFCIAAALTYHLKNKRT